MKRFYLAQMGWRLGDLMLHFNTGDERSNDFVEILLHHVVALFLVMGSYLANSMAVGALVMVYHDITDIGSSGLRVLGDSEYHGTKVTFFLYIAFLSSWMICRVALLPLLIY